MLRTWLLRVTVGVALLAGLGVVLFVTNPAPVVPALTAGDAARSDTPIVIKLHAQWCPLCMMTRTIWYDIEREYAGRVRMVVFDFTSDDTTAASRREAERVGLGSVFAEHEGETGTVVVLNGRTKTVVASIHGSHDPAEYRRALDDALRGAQ